MNRNQHDTARDTAPDALVGRVHFGLAAETATPLAEAWSAVAARLADLGCWRMRARQPDGFLGVLHVRLGLSGSDCAGGRAEVGGRLNFTLLSGGRLAVTIGSDIHLDLLPALRSVRPFEGEQACLDGGDGTAGPYGDHYPTLFARQQRLCAAAVGAVVGRLAAAVGAQVYGEMWVRSALVCRDYAAVDAVGTAAEVAARRLMLPGTGRVSCDWLPSRTPFRKLGLYPVLSWFDDLSTVRARRELRPLQPGLLRVAVELETLTTVRRALRRAGLHERRAPLNGPAAAGLLGAVARAATPDLNALLGLAESLVPVGATPGTGAIAVLGLLAPLLRVVGRQRLRRSPGGTIGKSAAAEAGRALNELLANSRYSWPATVTGTHSLKSALELMTDQPDGLLELDRTRPRTVVVRPAWVAACRALAASLAPERRRR